MPGPLDGLKRVGPQNTAEQELANILNAAAHAEDFGPFTREPYRDDTGTGLPMPRQPSGFRTGTLVPFDTDTDGLEQPWDMIRRIAPNMEGRSPSMTFGPATLGAVDLLERSGFSPHEMPQTNLLGITDTKNRIGLNPSLAPDSGFAPWDSRQRQQDELAKTVGHEMGHTVGIPEHEMPDIEGLVQMIRDYQRMNRGNR